jgi:septal ring factor EnvC (AmiA/AmiB activator)
MKRLFLLAVLLAQTGCLAPLTRRLDEANQRLADIQQQLAESKQELQKVERHLDESSRRLARLERSLQRFGGGADETAAPTPAQP